MNFPPLLKTGSKVIILAPSGKIEHDGIDKAILQLNEWGLEVVLAEHVYSSYATFAGKDQERLKDFQEALNDQSIDLILCARGGYGITRLLEDLSYNQFLRHPKWVLGFSDITAFQLDLLSMGLPSIHGPVGTSFHRDGSEESIQALMHLLFDGTSIIKSNADQLKMGFANAPLIGGNLALICDSLGTFSEIETQGKILIFEDIGEHFYRIDRMLTQLKRANKLHNLKGLVLGSFSNMADDVTNFGESVVEMVTRLTCEFNYPVAVSMPVGHEPQNFPFIQGAAYRLEVKKNEAILELATK